MANEMNEALSILNRLEQEARSWELQRAAFKEVRKVIEQYMIAAKFMGELDVSRVSLEESIAHLQSRYDAEFAAMQGRLREENTRLDAELQLLHERRAQAKAELDKIESDFAARQEVAHVTMTSLGRQISDAQKELKSLNKDIDELKSRHGLGG